MSLIHPQRRSAIGLRRGVVAALSLGVLGAIASSGLNAPAAAHASAHASRTVSLNDSGRLHLTSKHGFTLNEQGIATGTVRGEIFVHLKIVSTKAVTAEVNIYPPGGSISGHASASYQKQATIGTFSGSMSVGSGSGSYSHATGSGLSFSGTIQKSNDAVTVHVNGTVTD
jgi:hypothetical protein